MIFRLRAASAAGLLAAWPMAGGLAAPRRAMDTPPASQSLHDAVALAW